MDYATYAAKRASLMEGWRKVRQSPNIPVHAYGMVRAHFMRQMRDLRLARKGWRDYCGGLKARDAAFRVQAYVPSSLMGDQRLRYTESLAFTWLQGFLAAHNS